MTPSEPTDRSGFILVNRAPVLTLWAAVVAERLGFDRDEALTLGRALAGLNAQSKGRALGIFRPASASDAKRKRAALRPGESFAIELMGRAVPAMRTKAGVRALERGDHPADPAAVERYLVAKFGDSLAPARRALAALAGSMPPTRLAASAFALYESFRPEVPAGTRGWGAKGVLDLARVRALAARSRD
jgi:hypothetical protein